MELDDLEPRRCEGIKGTKVTQLDSKSFGTFEKKNNKLNPRKEPDPKIEPRPLSPLSPLRQCRCLISQRYQFAPFKVIRNPDHFGLWNPESMALESGIQLMEPGIKNRILKFGIQPLEESRIHGWGIRNPHFSWITLHKAIPKSDLVNKTAGRNFKTIVICTENPRLFRCFFCYPLTMTNLIHHPNTWWTHEIHELKMNTTSFWRNFYIRFSFKS